MKSSLSLQFVNQQFVKTCSSHQKNTSPIGTVPRFTGFAKVHLQHHENEAAQGDEVIMSCYWKLYHIWCTPNPSSFYVIIILSSNYYAKLHGIKLKLEWKCIHTSDFWRINCKSQANGNFEGFFFDLCREAKKQLQQLLMTAQHKMLATQQRGSKCWWSDTRYYEIQSICPNMMLYTTIPPSPSTPALQLHPHHDPLARSKKQSSVTGTAFQSGEYECSFRPSRKHYHSSWRIGNDFLAVRFKASEVDGVFCLVVSSKAKNYEL